MSKIKIFLDAGHNNSSFNTGASGNGMREQDITFQVAKKLSDILKDDFDVMLSRPTQDTNLGTDNASAVNARWQLANKWGADYFISIHCNAGGGTGSETFYLRPDSLKFATTVEQTYSKIMGLRSRRIERRDNLAVLNRTIMPSILIELAFIDSPLSNPDVNILRNKRPEMAQALADGIYKYFNIVVSKPAETENENVEAEEMRYNTVQEVPTWGRETIQKMIDKKILNGDGNSLNLSEDMIRIFVTNDRANLYN